MLPVPVLRVGAVALVLAYFLQAPPRACATSPSLLPGMPPEVRSLREETLSPEQYRDLVRSWRAYLEDHPTSAVAHVMLSRAMRYAHDGTVDTRSGLLRKAYELDLACPEALEGLSGVALGEGDLGRDEARTLAERAVELAPTWPRPHFTLWSLAMTDGDEKAAAPHARALIDKGALPAPLLDFAHNLLVSADANAIVFTNGDNDTYPPAALQTKHGTRPDVRIANLSMLNLLDYAILVLGDGPLTEKEIRTIHAGWNDRYRETGQLFSAQLLGEVLKKVRTGQSRRPVYLAVTVAPGTMQHVEQKLRLEGLLWRVRPERNGHDSHEEPDLDFEKTLRLFRRDFRLDSATDLGFPWEQRSSIRMLMTNYPALLRCVGTGAAQRGDLESFRSAMDRAIRIVKFHGDENLLETLCDYRDEIDPGRAGAGD